MSEGTITHGPDDCSEQESGSEQPEDEAASSGRCTRSGDPRVLAGVKEIDPDLAPLCELYDRHSPSEDLAEMTAEGLVAAVRSHRRLAERRAPGRAALRIRDGDVEATSGRMIVEIITDEMPFLVDSVLAGIARSGVHVHRVLHPIIVVRRDPSGALVEVLPEADPSAPPEGSFAESWMRVETDQLTDGEGRDQLSGHLLQILAEVREVVEDATGMEQTARDLAAALHTDPPPLPETEVRDVARLLEWLADNNAMFLGYRRYELETSGGKATLTAVVGSGLGVLRRDTASVRSFAPGSDAVERATSRQLMIISRASTISRVSQPVYPGYLSVKTFDEQGIVTGEHRFLCLLSVAGLHENVLDIPLVERRVRAAIRHAGFPLDSYSGRKMLEVLSDYPRERLFQASVDELYEIAVGVLALAGRRGLRLFMHRDPYHRFFSCLVYLPRDRYTTSSRLAVQEILCRELGGSHVEYTARVTESSVALLHVTVRTNPEEALEPDLPALQEQLWSAVQDWDDHVLAQCSKDPQRGEAVRRYLPHVPGAYREDFDPADAVADLARLDALTDEPDMSFYSPPRAAPGEWRFKLYLTGKEVTLSQLLPVLQHMGVDVVEERPYRVTRPDGQRCWIYDFGLRVDDAVLAEMRARGDVDVQSRFCSAFSAAWRGDNEIDSLNGLVLRAGLTWRQVALLRAYAHYQRQIGTRYGQHYIAETLIGHAEITEALVGLFETRFTPELGTDADAQQRVTEVEDHLAEVTKMIDDVSGLDADRILRVYLNLITATVRTNYFAQAPYLALKLQPESVRNLPRPAPRFEIYAYSPRVEGVHLRFGPVARGGLRWSDRPADFRTEVLGLAKAQAVKNAVIVPVGAKGGFVVKRPPALTGDADADREAWQAEGIECYRMFISSLLDVTDNLVDGRTVPPEGLVCHDGDDSYLVVAADKGTATFSDIANDLAVERDFWLADAFASGGSAGYDHKTMGITARGAWESVKRHFRELGVDTQSQDFTVVGVGDMSGDVFGNGMLLSEHIRLIAAFDHRHVFVDPDPDPARSFAERRRLFEQDRSSWDEYDRCLISEGGGVWSRTAKSVQVSRQMRAALGLADSVTSLSPPELMHAILLAPADLLWNGGVGTYVKAEGESNADVGDKANDAVRVDAAWLRVKVIGEGGNLGLTQRGRIEFARHGGKINNDALDNSAGVECSDHEVNIKISLRRVMAAGKLDLAGRDTLLEEMTDEVAELVLADNISQNAMLGVARSHAPKMVTLHARLVADLEARTGLDRELQVLPDPAEFTALAGDDQGLTSPELATLLAHVKLDLKQRLLHTDLLDAAVFAERLQQYFPPALRERYPDAVAHHPLGREILTTQLVNEMVDGGGITFAFRLGEDTVADPADAIRAYMITTEVFGLRELWAQIHRLNSTGELGPDTALADRLILHSRRLLDRAARWFLVHRPQPLAVGAEISRFQPSLASLRERVPELLGERESNALTAHIHEILEHGAPKQLAERCARLLNEFGLLDVIEVAELADRDEPNHAEIAELYFALSQHLRIDGALDAVTNLERGDHWHALARQALREDLYGSLRAITLDVLRESNPGESVEEKINRWERMNATRLARTRSGLHGVSNTALDLATLSVVARQLRALIR